MNFNNPKKIQFFYIRRGYQIEDVSNDFETRNDVEPKQGLVAQLVAEKYPLIYDGSYVWWNDIRQTSTLI